VHQIPITELKERVAAVSSVDVDKQRLIFRGKVLKDENKLSDFGLEDNDTLHLIIRKDDAPAPSVPAPAAAAASTSAAPPGRIYGGLFFPALQK
jgi:ubiquilin